MSKIVLAETKEEVPSSIRVALQGAGYDIVTADDCGAVIDLVRAREAEVAIVDAELPPYGAATVVDSLKSDRDTCRVPVLVLCSPQALSRAEEAVELGAADYCLKPVDIRRLLGKLDLAVRAAAFRSEQPDAADAPPAEKRVHPRAEVETPIQVVIDGITMDISEGGMRISAPVEMPDELALTVVSQFISELVGKPVDHVQARIVHHHRLNGKFAYGVTFLDMSDDVARAIRRWIHAKR